MNVLILGSGGREHAMAWKLNESPKLKKLFIAPGNPGTAQCGTNVALDPLDFQSIATFALNNNINMIVVGPEAPLVAGIYDYFIEKKELQHICAIGPSKKGAALEGSKDFSKLFMSKYQIPTARYCTVELERIEEGFAFIDTLISPYVLKADGLAGGKGVLILEDAVAAKNMLKEMLRGKFGPASKKVVIEEYLHGIEVSVFVLTDGVSYKILPEAKDYKRIGEKDQGLNTGGMGAVSPVHFADAAFIEKVRTQIIEPTLNGLKAENIVYKGFIFIGLMNCGGNPYTIEYNVRMGDPETEVVLPRLNADLLDLFEGLQHNNLESRACAIYNHTALTVVMAAGGYPETFQTGKVISGLDKVSEKDTLIFHAGTTLNNESVVTNSGRVLAITSWGDSIKDAQQKAYAQVKQIKWEDAYFRSDIGKDLEE